MPQSLVKNYVHIIFSTKHREPFIKKEMQEELFGYLGGICQRMECSPIIVGGYKNHVHILSNLSRKTALMKLIEELKSHSSRWVKRRWEGNDHFYWQKGYGTFSVNPKRIDIVTQYIQNQEAHHSKFSFQHEFMSYLEKYQVEYDERYVWD